MQKDLSFFKTHSAGDFKEARDVLSRMKYYSNIDDQIKEKKMSLLWTFKTEWLYSGGECWDDRAEEMRKGS